MFWIFLVIFGAAASLVTLGMLAVWVKVLTAALAVAAGTVVLLLIWATIKKRFLSVFTR